MRYHINPKTLKVGKCSAKNCPFGKSSPHFSSKENANNFLEKTLEHKYSDIKFQKHSSSSFFDTMTEIEQQEIQSYVDRNDPDWKEYYSATDLKHFGAKNEPGSKFLDPSLQKIEDILALAFKQRGNLEGNDKEKFIEKGASPEAFNENNRYLMVHTKGTLGIKNSSTMKNSDMVEIVRTKPGAPCSVVADVTTQETTDYAVVILSEDSEAGKSRLITTFPGLVTKTIENERIESAEGQKLTIAEIRKIFNGDIFLNTRIR